ncbi:TPA: helix-turn-helix transcriptional regulator [Streptococcus pneumoniae]|uniref:helix-turn-helix domain-containing protein n=1 Tax=Streptococcus pneumoniae TaxID=1313 RepID=UPI000909BC0A|nr:helix-turn-helix transcriptional regulator [Streptococcus pneumoniae]APJ30868.1 phage repressor [Streptococcus pneumoniae]MDG7217506.1 helix-turn-helix transcriptional regulator [Streptococcus pneumoniae]MDG8284805.1 helix-turn-helix transcriptional regulator [Streptococcus pneumoniae]CAG6065491.1 phage repressor [Streptococcus pneumoniae]CAG7495989.1 phage repressor [Streptococcus pneumoniae]
MFSLFEKIKELCQKRGISINSLEETLGYSRNTIYSMKSKKPNAERLQEIADYFNVSTDYLLGRTDNPVIAGDKVAKAEIDLKKDAAESFFYDGHELNDEDLDLISSLLEARMRNRK